MGVLVKRVDGSLVVVVRVLAAFGRTSNVIIPACNERGAIALFASTISALDGFLGVVNAALFDMFAARSLLFAARSLVGGFRSHRHLSGYPQ
jgi:hypothetical protein